MVRGILFKDERFIIEEDNNLMCPMTENTIILCPNYEVMCSFTEEILNTINGIAGYNEIDCNANDFGKAELKIFGSLQRVINVNEQRIILCVEPAMIYRADQIEDIWFIDWQGSDDNYKEFIYPMSIFEGSQEVWDEGLDKVYKMIVDGRYGCYYRGWEYLD